jgi:hypothetical protein
MSPAQIAREWWGEPWRRSFILIAAAIAAITAFMHFAEVAEPYWIATRQFSRNLVSSAQVSFDQRQLKTEIAIKQLARDNMQAQIDRLQYELQKNPNAPDSLTRLIVEQIRRYTEQLRIINFELDDLRRRAAGRRP